MRENKLKTLVFLTFLSVAMSCWSSDEYNIPQFEESTKYESSSLGYEVVGAEVHNGVRYLWVVVKNIQSKNNRNFREIIADLNSHYPEGYEFVNFYTKYSLRESKPAFRITDDYASFSKSESILRFGTASGKNYGGWFKISK